MKIELPVPILDHPHWRVNIRPEEYQEELIDSLSSCEELIEKTTVRIRGWPFPNLSPRREDRDYGDNYVASWSPTDYWRLYQSGQFVHISVIREVTELGWKEKLESRARSQLGAEGDIPGFISIPNFLYRVAEIFEFSARLCQKGVYRGAVTITIELKGIKGFVLMASEDRWWLDYYASSRDILKKSWTLNSDILIAECAEQVLKATLWFFERFGWLDPPKEALRNDIQNCLKGRL